MLFCLVIVGGSAPTPIEEYALKVNTANLVH